MKIEINKRTFEAAKYPKASIKRNILNQNSLTSEYYTSKKYQLLVYVDETERCNAYILEYSYRTKKEAVEASSRFEGISSQQYHERMGDKLNHNV